MIYKTGWWTEINSSTMVTSQRPAVAKHLYVTG